MCGAFGAGPVRKAVPAPVRACGTVHVPARKHSVLNALADTAQRVDKRKNFW